MSFLDTENPIANQKQSATNEQARSLLSKNYAEVSAIYTLRILLSSNTTCEIVRRVILNRDTNVQCDPNLLPQPDHVMVNHMYALSIKVSVLLV
ncbi:unnamed protein product [Trichobilharzia regenti]|nr:unnamed protein product [Trichobilharzia regenti]